MIRRNIFSVGVALVIMYMSLVGANSFDRLSFFDFPGLDKIVHAGMYFTLMSVIIIEHKKGMEDYSGLLLISLIPFFYGIFLEIGQWLITSTRTGSFTDVIANYLGILLSVFVFIIIKGRRKKLPR